MPGFDLLIKGIVTFSIERESIVVRLLSRFPAIAQLDPRDFLSDRCARPFLDDIESIRVEGDSLQYEDADDSVIVRSSFSRAGHSREHAIAFSKRFDMLPTAQWWSLDGAVVSMASCRYAAPLKDAGTVAESVTFRFRPKDRLLFDAFAGDASSTNWGTISETIVSEMRSPSDSELAMLNEIDNHWRLPVVDTRLPAPPRPTIINQDPGPSDAAPAADLSNRRVWLVVLIGTVLIAGVVVLRSRSRAR